MSVGGGEGIAEECWVNTALGWHLKILRVYGEWVSFFDAGAQNS